MLPLQEAVDRYIELRITLGFNYRVEAGLLRRFGAFALHHRQNRVTTAVVMQWAEHMNVAPGTAARAVSVVRTFAKWRAAEDELTEVPPKRLFPAKKRRARPFIHTDEQLMALLEAARGLEPLGGLRGLTYSTVFALISVTGMRISEAVNLNFADVDLQAGVLMVRESKFKKSRLIPIHETTRRALVLYAKRRDATLTRRHDPAFFVAANGKRVQDCDLRNGFAVASRRVGQRTSNTGGRKRGRGPRVHDLRHGFAVKTLLDWYRQGKDVEREMPKLVTYLGHGTASDTHWYIEAVPELLHLAAQRVERRKGRHS